MERNLKTQYVGIRIKGLAFWLWFKNDADHFLADDGKVIAAGGWGDEGAYIGSFECPDSEVVSIIYSETLGYR